MNSLSKEELEKHAREDLGENQTRITEDISALREWITKSPHLAGIRKDEAQLLKFLRGCKFSLERTKEKLDLYNSVRANLPDWFGNWDPASARFQKILGWGNYLPLPGYDKQGRQVVLIRTGRVEPTNTDMGEIVSTVVALQELLLEGNNQAQVKGVVVLNDLAGAGPQHALLFNPVIAKKVSTIFQDAYPARPKGMHFLNFPPAMQSVFSMMQSFQKEKMKKRSKIHQKGDYTALYEELGKDVLPTEYGGNNGSVEDIKSDWVKRVMDSKDWLMEQTTYKSDETRRPGKPRSQADIFGIEGSFRKLEID